LGAADRTAHHSPGRREAGRAGTGAREGHTTDGADLIRNTCASAERDPRGTGARGRPRDTTTGTAPRVRDPRADAGDAPTAGIDRHRPPVAPDGRASGSGAGPVPRRARLPPGGSSG